MTNFAKEHKRANAMAVALFLVGVVMLFLFLWCFIGDFLRSVGAVVFFIWSVWLFDAANKTFAAAKAFKAQVPQAQVPQTQSTIIVGIAGEALSTGDVVALKDGKLYKANV